MSGSVSHGLSHGLVNKQYNENLETERPTRESQHKSKFIMAKATIFLAILIAMNGSGLIT